MEKVYKQKKRKIEYKDSFAYHIEQELKESLEVHWDFKKNEIDPRDIRKNSKTKVWIKCKTHSYHNSYQVSCNSFAQGKRCPYCKRIRVHQLDSLGFLYYDIAKLIDEDDQGNKVNIIDTYEIAPYKHKKYIFKCSRCGNKSRKRLDFVTYRGFCCDKCSDGKSFGEKFIFYLLKLKNINFINQLSKHNFKWCDKYRYDFYLPEYNIIIDTEGYYNYSETINNINMVKEKLAINNGIIYKKINYSFNNKRTIEKNTIEALKEIIDFDDIDFEEIYKLSNESLVFKVCEQWNKGKSTLEISNELCLARATIIKYLKKGNELGIANYDSKLEMKYNVTNTNKNKRKKIICKTTGEVFNSQLEAAHKYNISTASIISCCKGKRDYGGKIKESGEKLVWCYY